MQKNTFQNVGAGAPKFVGTVRTLLNLVPAVGKNLRFLTEIAAVYF